VLLTRYVQLGSTTATSVVSKPASRERGQSSLTYHHWQCPLYCMFCTRSYAVGADTDSVQKASKKPTRSRWNDVFAYIESQPQLHDVVVSGGDCYLLTPEQITLIGDRLIGMPNIRRFRFASKGLAVSPGRILDNADGWADALVHVSNKARGAGKCVALHTHFNHPNELTCTQTRSPKKKLYLLTAKNCRGELASKPKAV
jgi:lysine 2,3-aminomutase